MRGSAKRRASPLYDHPIPPYSGEVVLKYVRNYEYLAEQYGLAQNMARMRLNPASRLHTQPLKNYCFTYGRVRPIMVIQT